MITFHFMILPPLDHEHLGDHDWLWTFVLWMAPFLILYFWHWWHDHRHNHILEKRLAEIVERLDRILENSRKGNSP